MNDYPQRVKESCGDVADVRSQALPGDLAPVQNLCKTSSSEHDYNTWRNSRRELSFSLIVRHNPFAFILSLTRAVVYIITNSWNIFVCLIIHGWHIFHLFFSSILEKEGPRSLFRGLGPNLVGVAPSRYSEISAYMLISCSVFFMSQLSLLVAVSLFI